MGIFAILPIAFALAMAFGKKIEETVGVSIICASFIVYLFGMIRLLKVGPIVIVLISGIASVYIIFAIVKSKGKLMRVVFSAGTLILLFFLLFFAFYNYGRDLKHPDEYMVWGLMPKNYYYFDDMFSPYSSDLGMYYPPIVSLWLYFANKTWICFSDSICLWAQSLLTISFVIPWFSKIRGNKRFAGIAIFTVVSPLILKMWGEEAFSYILQDSVIAGLLCLLVYCIIEYSQTSDEFYHVSTILSLAFLFLTKNAGIIIGTLMYMVYIYAIKRKKSELKSWIWPTLLLAIVSASWNKVSVYSFCPLIAFFCIWIMSNYVNRLFSRVGKRAITFLILLASFSITFASLPFEWFRNLPYVYKESIGVFREYSTYTLSMVDSRNFIIIPYILCPLVLFILSNLIEKNHLKRNEKFIPVMEGICIAEILYAVVVAISYVRLIAPSNYYVEWFEDRYWAPWVVVTVYICIYYYLDSYEGSLLGYVTILLVVISVADVSTFIGDWFDRWHNQGHYAFQDANVELKPGDKVFYIDETPIHEVAEREFLYNVVPAKTNYSPAIGELGRLEYSSEELSEILNDGYNYVYIQSVKDDFLSRYENLFACPESFSTGAVYAVLKVDNKTALKLLE